MSAGGVDQCFGLVDGERSAWFGAFSVDGEFDVSGDVGRDEFATHAVVEGLGEDRPHLDQGLAGELGLLELPFDVCGFERSESSGPDQVGDCVGRPEVDLDGAW